MSDIRPMQLYIANIPFDEQKGEKIRPALVIDITLDEVLVFKITSKYMDKSITLPRLYYPINQWRQAGLKTPSYVDTHQIYALPRSKVFARKPIGALADIDILELDSFLKLRKQ